MRLVWTTGLCVCFAMIGCDRLYDCDSDSERHTRVAATVTDTSGAFSINALVDVGDLRTPGNPESRDIDVELQAMFPPDPAPEALVGHVSRFRLELADGTTVYETTLQHQQDDPSSLVGSNHSAVLSADEYSALAARLVRDSVFMVLTTDAGAPVMPRTRMQLTQNSVWRFAPCW